MTDLREVDRDLVEGAKSDPGMFARLYGVYFPRVYGYVAMRVGSVESAEDIVSEVFFKLVQGLGTFQWRDENSFSAWVFRIAHNATVSYWRKTKKYKEWEDGQDGDPALEILQDREALPEEQMLKKEQSEQMRRLVGKLPQRRQEVITLRFFGELQNREIASILGLDEHTVASHICRGLKDLHRLWVEENASSEL
ncbi:MAG: sigma-70 family RNA polymerase sigma factor [Chloroflexia bacterium]